MAKASARSLTLTYLTETPSGTVDGANAAFTLSAAPYSSAQAMIFVDGLFISPTLYTLSGTALTFTSAPSASSDILVRYLRNI